jgi:hypothetical protein
MQTEKQKQAMLKAALNIDELAYDLDNISNDDGKPVEGYTQAEIVHEARYVLEKFHNEIGGHWNNYDLRGENGSEQQKWARGEVRKLNAFIKKYE